MGDSAIFIAWEIPKPFLCNKNLMRIRMKGNRNIMTKNKQVICIGVAILGFLFTIVWIALLNMYSDTESRCIVKTEDTLFSLGMESMNETKEKTYTLAQGDVIDVSVVYIAGELNISIADQNGNVIYKGHNPEIGSFGVNITENSEYTISVTGKQAEGSISFRIIKKKERF